jgi:hypothetical protein
MNAAPQTSGGHPHSRGVADSLQADSMMRLVVSVIKFNMMLLNANRRLKTFHVPDVGAKFSKIGRLLQDFCSMPFSDFFA